MGQIVLPAKTRNFFRGILMRIGKKTFLTQFCDPATKHATANIPSCLPLCALT